MFWKKRQPQFDAEKHVGQILLGLQSCTRRVIAIDDTLDNTFTCTYVVLAESLLSWMEDFKSKVYVCGAKEQATQTAFLMWLRGANHTEGDYLSRVPKMFFDFYGSYASELVKATDGFIYCNECQTGYDEATIKFENTKQEGGGWHSGVEVWRCPKHHLLRQNNFRGHLLLCPE